MSSKTALGAQGGERQVTVPLRDTLGPLDYKLTGDAVAGPSPGGPIPRAHGPTGLDDSAWADRGLASLAGRSWTMVPCPADGKVPGGGGSAGRVSFLGCRDSLVLVRGLRQGADPVKITLG